MKSFAFVLEIDSFSDRYTYSSSTLKLPDLCVFGKIDTDTFDDLFWLSEKRGAIEIVVIDDTEPRWTGKLFHDGVSCKAFVTQRELANLRATLSKLTEEKIQLSFMAQGSLNNPDNLHIGNLVKDRLEFDFDFVVTGLSRTVRYDNTVLNPIDENYLDE